MRNQFGEELITVRLGTSGVSLGAPDRRDEADSENDESQKSEKRNDHQTSRHRADQNHRGDRQWQLEDGIRQRAVH